MVNKASLVYMHMLVKYCPKYITSIQVRATKVIIYINSESLMPLIVFLSKSIFVKASNLLDIWAVDYPDRANRFEINYLLVSLKNQVRFIIKTSVSEYRYLPSVTALFPSANWLEREV